MIIKLSPGRHDLLEPHDYARLKLQVPAGWSVADIERGLPFGATCSAEHVWIKEADLRAIAAAGGSESEPLSGMIDKAKKYGFYDEANGTIRVHVEYD